MVDQRHIELLGSFTFLFTFCIVSTKNVILTIFRLFIYENMMVSTTENRIPSMNSIFSTIDTNAATQGTSNTSRRNSLQSGESIGDVLDLYADSDSDSDSVFEQNHNDGSIKRSYVSKLPRL